MTCCRCGKCDDCLGVAQRGADGSTPTAKPKTEAQRLHVNQDAEWFASVNRRMRELGLDKDNPTRYATGGPVTGGMYLVGEHGPEVITGEHHSLTIIRTGDFRRLFLNEWVAPE